MSLISDIGSSAAKFSINHPRISNFASNFGGIVGDFGTSYDNVINSSNIISNNDFMEYLSGLLASTGQESVENRLFNADEAQKSRDFSAEENKKARDWQEHMSNTAYQRTVADLQKAGLNPILAYQQGSNSAPYASSASSAAASSNNVGGDTLSSVLNAFANLISSASGIVSKLIPNVT